MVDVMTQSMECRKHIVWIHTDPFGSTHHPLGLQIARAVTTVDLAGPKEKTRGF